MEESANKLDVVRHSAYMAAVAVALAAAAFLLWRLFPVLITIFGGLLFAIVLRHAGGGIAARTPLSQRSSVALLLLLLAACVGFGLWQFGTQLAGQFHELADTLGSSYQRVSSWLASHGVNFGDGQIEQDLLSALSSLGPVLERVLFGVLLIAFVMIYVSLSPAVYRKGFVLLFPKSFHDRVENVLDAVDTALWRWTLGQFISMASVGLLTGIAMWLIGVPLATLLGLISGLLEFVPVLGPWLAAIPAGLVALSVGPRTALWALLAYAVVQQIESWVLSPLAERFTVSLPPALTLIAIAGLGALFGTTGVLFATPIALVITVSTRILYVQDVLDERLAKTKLPQ